MLNSHLYNNLHVVDNSSCRCGHQDEDTEHFFFHCSEYSNQRQLLMIELDQQTMNIDSVLHGDDSVTIEDNYRRLDAIYVFIKESKRFDRLQVKE